jgi:hypothetical protein
MSDPYATVIAPESDPYANIIGEQVTAGPKSGLPPINQSAESLAPERFMAGLKTGPEGVARYLESVHGKGNVATDKDGAFYVKERGEWHPFDSPEINTRDAFDLSGLGVAAIPVAGGELAAGKGAGMLATGLRTGMEGLAGSMFQQAAGQLSPGGDPMTLGQRATMGGLDTATGGAGGLVARALSRLYSAPRNAIISQMGKADTPVARQGQAISDYLMQGYDPKIDGPIPPSLSLGQQSQRKSILTFEGALRRSPTGAGDLFQQKDEAQLVAGRRRWDELMDNISRNPKNAEMMGNQLTTAFKNTVNNAMDVLDRQGRSDFAFLDQASGKAPVFTLPNTAKALDDLIGRYDVPGAATDVTKGIVRQLTSARDAFVNGGNLSPKSAVEFQRLLSSWGRAAAGSQTLFGDLDKREAMGVAKRVFGALNDDLSAAAASQPGPVADALRLARDNYRQNFQAVDQLRKSSIGQYLGFKDGETLAPEAVADRMAAMKPTQLRQTFQLLDNADPELAGDAKRHLLERAMTAAQSNDEKLAEKLGAGQLPGPEDYSPARLIGNLVRSPVLGALSQTEQFGVQRLAASMQRLSNRAGTEGSPTGPLLWAMDMAKNLVSAGFTGDVIGAAKLVGTWFAPTKIAAAITNPKQLNALVTLLQPKPAREAILTAAGTLSGMEATRAAQADDVRPFAELPKPALLASPE